MNINISDSVAPEHSEIRVCCCNISELQCSYGTRCCLLNGYLLNGGIDCDDCVGDGIGNGVSDDVGDNVGNVSLMVSVMTLVMVSAIVAVDCPSRLPYYS